MIKASDLMIGSLVTDEFYENFKNIIEVRSINDKGINLVIEDDGNYPELAQTWIEPEYTFDYLQGIPITEEWLDKSNLIKIDSGYYRIENYTIKKYHIHWCWGFIYTPDKGNSLKEIKYIHELQNLVIVNTKQELKILA